MTWLNGQDLSQTVFTCLYTLHLAQLAAAANTTTTTTSSPTPYPHQMLSLVLHTYVLATLKCIDLASQEFARGNLQEVRLY